MPNALLGQNARYCSYHQAAAEKARAIMHSRQATLLAIETSCDETAAAVVRQGREVLSNVVYSQIPLHEKYGGVVPEVASRNHVEKLGVVVKEALVQAGIAMREIDGVAVTNRPGLVGALLTGVSYAKGLCFAMSLPLIGVDHIAGHIAANYISHLDLEPPFVALVASGGHSHLFHITGYTKHQLLGRTRDDAAGEAFDKVARALKLGYPGGPKLEQLAKEGNPYAYKLPIGMHMDDSLDFSFSGLKTAVVNCLHKTEQKGEAVCYADVAASFQYSLVESLTQKSLLALKRQSGTTLALCGGVSANRALIGRLREAVTNEGCRFVFPHASYTGDNAAMIGCAGYYALLDGQLSGLDLNAQARNIYI